MLLMTVVSSPDLLFAQERSVSGTIKEDATGSPIPGVNIIVKGTTSGTVSDIDGNYRINVPEDATLVFSAVGFVTEEIPVSNRSVIDVTMSQDIQSLSEVVVVGYGTQERARVTGAISSVSSKQISEMPVASLDQALQGRAAGIAVTNTGSPGVSPLVRIRGLGTVGNNDPLYVIDGMPSGGLNNINPNDIESIDILKDASAASIYGSRAANGVVLVTTKKGSRGATAVNVDAYYGVQKAWRTLDLLNRDQYMDYARDLLANDPANFDTNPDNNVSAPSRFSSMGDFANVDTDWQDEMFNTAIIRDYNVSVTGGGENSLFNIGGGYFKQDGIMLGTGFKRYSFRANSEFKLGKRVKVGETMTLAYSDRNNEPFNGGRSQIEHMIKMVPYIPVYDPSRLGGFRATDAADASDPENPVLNAVLRKNTDENLKLLGTAYATYEIIEGLEYKLMLGLDMNFGYNNQFTPRFNAGSYHQNPTTDINQNRTDFISPLISNQLNYRKTFDKHNLDAVAVFERLTSLSRNTGGSGETDLTDDIQVLGGLASPNIQGGRTEYALLSYLGRINYDFDGKYLLSASVRRDGGSRFGPGYKWGTFPAFSAGWRISQEAFMANVPVISDLKLRASWGKTGNDRIGDYRYQSTIDGQFRYNFNGVLVPGFTSRDLVSSDIIWETTVMTNLGIDFGFLNDKIRASVEYFNNETQDMLLPVPVPASLGYDVAPTRNVGNVTNKGFEVTAGYFQSTGDFQWSVNGNISFVTNELTSLGVGNSVSGQTFENDVTTFTTVGQPIGYFFGWETDGIFQQGEVEQANAIDGDASSPYQSGNTRAGDIRFKDINGDGQVNNADRVVLGHYLPDFSYGLNATANFKNFDLSLFIQGVSGNEILNTNRYDLEGMTRLFNSGTAVLNRWTPENTNTDVPRAVNTDPNRNSRLSSRFVEDGSYLRIKNLSIGYTLPTTALNAFGGGFIKNVRFYVTSQNLLTVTDYTGYDPEIGARPDLSTNANNATLNAGVDYGQYPQPRTFLGGVQIGF